MGQRLTKSMCGKIAASLTFPTHGVRQGAPEMILQDVRDDLFIGLDMTIFFTGDPAMARTAAWVDDIYLMSGTHAGIKMRCVPLRSSSRSEGYDWLKCTLLVNRWSDTTSVFL